MVSTQSQAKVKELLQSGQKIEAIQFLCKEHNLSLPDANEWVQYLAGETSRPGAQPATISSSLIRARVEDLLRSKNKIQAIKLVMDEYQVSLKQANDLVDAMDPSRSPVLKDPIKYVLLLFVGLGILFAALSVYWLWADYQFTSNATPGTGTVVDFYYNKRGGGAAPIIEYTWNGSLLTYQGETYSNPPSVAIGEQVELFINPDNPKEVVINLVFERYILVITFGFMGFIFSLVGYLGLWMKKGSKTVLKPDLSFYRKSASNNTR
ncbi:MAG: hypothetical protein BroJett042_01950 [Bacteroidota bacterium]|nr:MAG: hypothetical protein BroJett042_01950 [Bacteroidota bacterium]